MRKRYKIWLIIILVLLVVVLAIGALKLFIKDEPEKTPKNTTNVILNIDKFKYTLDDRDSKYMKELFNELAEVLNKEEINYEEYAKLLAKLFVVDFYTLNNKINKYDIGSLEYILNDKVDMFKSKAMDTIYNDIIDNTYKDRVQDLPEITNVEILNLEKTQIDLNNTKIDAYKITMNYNYKKDLGYDKEGTLYLIKNDTKLEVAIYSPEIKNDWYKEWGVLAKFDPIDIFFIVIIGVYFITLFCVLAAIIYLKVKNSSKKLEESKYTIINKPKTIKEKVETKEKIKNNKKTKNKLKLSDIKIVRKLFMKEVKKLNNDSENILPETKIKVTETININKGTNKNTAKKELDKNDSAHKKTKRSNVSSKNKSGSKNNPKAKANIKTGTKKKSTVSTKKNNTSSKPKNNKTYKNITNSNVKKSSSKSKGTTVKNKTSNKNTQKKSTVKKISTKK